MKTNKCKTVIFKTMLTAFAIFTTANKYMDFHKQNVYWKDGPKAIGEMFHGYNKSVGFVSDYKESNESVTYYVAYEDDGSSGLGNSMFRLASMIGLAKASGKTPVLQNTLNLFSVFRINIKIVTNVTNFLDSPMKKRDIGSGIHKLSHLQFIKKCKRDFLLQGYFQSWKYFENARDEIKATFVFHKDILTQAEYIIDNIKTEYSNKSKSRSVLVGVHARRGDVTNEYFRSIGYTSPDADYYQKAMTYFTQLFQTNLVIFVVCSNEIHWTKHNFSRFTNFSVIYMSSSNSAGLDLALLSLCDHTIMSVGTFSWWAAWLTNGTTVYYSDWPKLGSILSTYVKHQDYFYPNWIPMK